ncbi:MAG TPA: 3-dehydroquinate synthase, partial [Acidobacteriota bacterium]|nr:3-dehydroquinate synthase [Acidobacteriota bacterium]
MKVVRVNLGARSYDIVIGGDILGKSRTLFQQHKVGSRLFLISNPTVFELYGKDWIRQFEAAPFEVTYFLIPDGEKYKTLQTVENIYTYLLVQQAD